MQWAVHLFVSLSAAKMCTQKRDYLKKTKQFKAVVSTDDLSYVDFSKNIWYTTAHLKLDDSNVTKYYFFNSRWLTAAVLKIVLLAITLQPIA